MSKLNILVHLNAYSDANSTNNPNLSNFKWSRELNGLAIEASKSEAYRIAPGQSLTIFNGSRSLSQDGTTVYDLAVKPGTSNTYKLSHKSGTAPAFKTLRNTAQDATSVFAVTKNANLITVTHSSGTAPAFLANGVVVGDLVNLTAPFVTQNQGTFVILAATATSISFENANGVPETTVTLTSGFATELRIFSSAGVQISDNLSLTAGFSSLSFGSYEITYVSDKYVEFYYSGTLPQESDINTQVSIYSSAKSLIYVESNKKLDATINGAQTLRIEPFVNANVTSPGMLLLKSTMHSLVLQNKDSAEATVFVASVE